MVKVPVKLVVCTGKIYAVRDSCLLVDEERSIGKDPLFLT